MPESMNDKKKISTKELILVKKVLIDDLSESAVRSFWTKFQKTFLRATRKAASPFIWTRILSSISNRKWQETALVIKLRSITLCVL